MNELSTYKLSILGAVVVLALSTGVVGLLGGWTNAAPYLAIVGTVALPALLALLRGEANAKQNAENHIENQDAIKSINQKIEQLRQ